MAFWMSKMAILHVVSWHFRISTIFNFSDFGPFKKYFRIICRVPDENWPKYVYHVFQTFFFYFDLTLTSRPWMIFTWNTPTESLGSYLEVPKTWSMLLYRLIFILYGRSAWQNQIRQIVKHFELGLTCDVIVDHKVNNSSFPSTSFPDLSNAVWIL